MSEQTDSFMQTQRIQTNADDFKLTSSLYTMNTSYVAVASGIVLTTALVLLEA